MHVVSFHDDTACGRTGQYCYRAILADGLHGAIEILRQIKRLDLGFIGKDNVDVVADEIQEALAVAFDTE